MTNFDMLRAQLKYQIKSAVGMKSWYDLSKQINEAVDKLHACYLAEYASVAAYAIDVQVLNWLDFSAAAGLEFDLSLPMYRVTVSPKSAQVLLYLPDDSLDRANERQYVSLSCDSDSQYDYLRLRFLEDYDEAKQFAERFCFSPSGAGSYYRADAVEFEPLIHKELVKAGFTVQRV